MPTIVISPYSQKMRPNATSNTNPKNYPWWEAVVCDLNKVGFLCVQVGVSGESKIEGVADIKIGLKLNDLRDLVIACDAWASVDNFFPHFCAAKCPQTPGVVTWGKSDPKIFGYKHNINLLKDRKFLKAYQYDIWEKETHDYDAFVSPREVVRALKKLCRKAEKT